MQGALAPRISRVQDLEEVELPTSRGPAAAIRIRAVLRCPWHLGIEDPDCWHVCGEAGFAGVRHREFEKEDFF